MVRTANRVLLVLLAVTFAAACSNSDDDGDCGGPNCTTTTTESSTSSSIGRSHACCIPGERCRDMGEGQCLSMGGVWEPPGSDPFCVPGICGSTTTSSLPAGGTIAALAVSLDDAVSVGGMVVEVDYGNARGRFVATSTGVDCTPGPGLVNTGGVFVSNDRKQDRVLALGFVFASGRGLDGPAAIATCRFDSADPDPVAGDFSVAIPEASDVDGVPLSPPPAVSLVVTVER